jgi:hypothetical protein
MRSFHNAPEVIWKTLTTGALIARWLMAPTGFEAVKGNRFTYQTKAAGAWDGTIHCEVLEAIPNERTGLQLEGRRRGQCRLWRAAQHHRHLHPGESRGGHAPAPGPWRLRAAEE